MKTIQLELSDRIANRVISMLALLPESECRIVETGDYLTTWKFAPKLYQAPLS